MPHRTHDGQEQVREAKRYPIEECDGLDDRVWADDAEVCPRCHGDGMDPWNDYLLPCPLCQGEQKP